jgi:hypothetical protein
MIKKYNVNNNPEPLNYIHIYEKYLNDLYKNINNDISIFNNEIIKEEGKEWIKLFTIMIWPKHYISDINYVIPSNLSFKGTKILEAIELLSDIQEIDKLKIETENNALKKFNEENQKIIKDKYDEGYKQGSMDGYQQGEADEYQQGEANGYQQGYQNMKIQMLDYYFNNYKNGKSIVNIESIGKVSFDFINKRYNSFPQFNGFIQELLSRDLFN